MKKFVATLTASIIGLGASTIPAALASEKQNGMCVGFAGTSSGHKYAGLKCYLDTAPGDWIINSSVMERNDAEQYQNLLGIPKRPFRCTLTKASVTVGNGIETTRYDLSNCSL